MTIESESKKQVFSIELSQDRVRRYLNYNPETGIFTWKNPISNAIKPGDIAGSPGSHGYISITVAGHRILAHRLAWFYVHGEWAMVDHINRQRFDNSLNNLRKITSKENSYNREVYCSNRLGVKGVQLRGSNYRAYISVDGVNISLGTYKTLEGAKSARSEAEIKYFGRDWRKA